MSIRDIPVIEVLGHTLVLTEVCPKRPSFDKNPFFTPMGDYLVPSIVAESMTPYALNFNLDISSEFLYKRSSQFEISQNGKFIHNNVLKSPNEQYCYMVVLINRWLQRFRASLRQFAGRNYSTIGSYGIFFELTQKGVIHAHGMMYINNSYKNQISQLMTMAWVKVSDASFKAQQKFGAAGKINRTFDYCNKPESWIIYITKEQHNKLYHEAQIDYAKTIKNKIITDALTIAHLQDGWDEIVQNF